MLQHPSMDREVQFLIDWLKLEPHPEGGYFRCTHKSGQTVVIPGYDGPRHTATTIYYMLAGNQFSAFHRIKSDEIWHFYRGSPLTLHVITPDGQASDTILGTDIQAGQLPQAVVKANCWFAASVNSPSSFSLVGCTVTPGFDYRDWELGTRDALLKAYSQHRSLVEKYTAR